MWKTNLGKANCFSRKSIQVDKRLDKKYTKEWFILLGLLLGVTVTNGFARFAYGLLLPAMQTQMDWNYAQAGWLSTVNARQGKRMKLVSHYAPSDTMLN